MAMAKKRLRALYSGTVQGVGFRFTAEHIARQIGVTGWVKNLPDGRVEVLAEGEEKKLAELLERIAGGALKNYIRNIEKSYSEPTGEYKDFTIRFW